MALSMSGDASSAKPASSLLLPRRRLPDWLVVAVKVIAVVVAVALDTRFV